MIYQTIGERLRHCLQDRNMSQKEFAEKIGVMQSTINKYVNDKQMPRADIIQEMCRVLGISADWLLGMIGE